VNTRMWPPGTEAGQLTSPLTEDGAAFLVCESIRSGDFDAYLLRMGRAVLYRLAERDRTRSSAVQEAQP
jgi:hypothetical protein